jgi:hypothetical protein
MNKSKPPPALERLRASREPLSELVHALVEDLLDRPLNLLIDREALPAEVAQAFRDVVRDPCNIAWFGEQLGHRLLQSAQFEGTGTLSDRTPKQIVEPLHSLATQPLVLNQDLVKALLDHPAFQGLIRELLTKSLLGYSKQIAELFPGGKTFTGLVGRARGLVASGLGDSTANLEHQANQFVEDSLALSISRAASYLAEEKSSESMSNWRGHMLETLLDRPLTELVTLVGRIDPPTVTDEVSRLMEAFAQWPELEASVAAILNSVLDAIGQQSLRQLIAGHDLEQQLRPLLEKKMVDAAWPFLQGEAFGQWFEKYLPS